LKLEVLKTFVAVGETRSFSKAGEMLFFSQSTVSRNIAELEKMLGAKLLSRNTRHCELTPFGQSMLPHAKSIVLEWEKIAKLALDHQKQDNASLQIGYTYRGMLSIIARVLADYRTSYSDTELTIRFGNGDEVTRLIRAGYLTCGVMHLPSLGSSEGLHIRLIKECTMYAMIPETHHLAHLSSVTMEQLSHETEVRVTTDNNFYEIEDNAFRRMNLSPMRSVTVGNSEECMPVMLYNNYVCLSPSIYEPWQRFKLLPITNWITSYPLVFVTQKDSRNEITEKLYSGLREILMDK